MKHEQLPPKHLTGEELWAEITNTPRPNRTIQASIRGIETDIAITVLTQEESMLCTMETEKYVRKALKDNLGEIPKSGELAEGYNRMFELKAAVSVLFQCCKNPNDISKPFFKSKEDIQRLLTVDEISVIFNEYLIIRYELGPIRAYMSESDVDAWVEKLADGGSCYPLGLLSSEALNQLVMLMACRLKNSPMDNGSLGTQPVEIF